MANFFQTERWWEFQRALGEEVVSGRGEGWHYFGRIVRDALGPYLYLPYGPVVADERTLDAAIADARAQAKRLGCYRLVIEPSLPITPEQAAARGKRMLTGFQPSRTHVVDLTQDEDEIVRGMNATRRKQHRGAAKRGYTFAECDDPADYDLGVELLRLTGETRSFEVRDGSYFEHFRGLVEEGIARVFVAKHEGETKVVGYVIDDEDTRYYLYVGRDLSNNSMQISAPFIVFLMLDAKARGLRTFDFYGISARDDVPDEWTGFTVFKRTFGGHAVQFSGAWEIPVKPGRYAVRRTLDALHELRAKLRSRGATGDGATGDGSAAKE
ncbi:lipid II:glycine glycyltransferase FemX [Leucobacter sp. VD1]|uniref:lipid II:glycine glycyltransferase FemX n=1 Tax=Leucobacter sp. VD1 TaxID=3080381 RepID=UPI00301807A6